MAKTGRYAALSYRHIFPLSSPRNFRNLAFLALRHVSLVSFYPVQTLGFVSCSLDLNV